MIARVRAWVGARRQLNEEITHQLATVAEQDAVIGRLSGMLSTEQLTTAGLTSEVKELTRRVAELLHRAEAAEATVARLQADHTYVTAERCECGGDTELHWRTRAVAAEAQAGRDRANAIRLTDEVERLQLKVDEAERLEHIVEQLGRVQ